MRYAIIGAVRHITFHLKREITWQFRQHCVGQPRIDIMQNANLAIPADAMEYRREAMDRYQNPSAAFVEDIRQRRAKGHINRSCARRTLLPGQLHVSRNFKNF
jgi:hypothetical protein